MFHFPKMAGADGKNRLPHAGAINQDSSKGWVKHPLAPDARTCPAVSGSSLT
jgi:hypothetical protein